MKPIMIDTDERRWQAVCERDAGADGQFVFAVLTTGVCCRPSCRSRRALRENVRFYPDVASAQAEGFRPCKRCQPEKTDPQQQKVEKVAAACRLLEQETPITLEALGQGEKITDAALSAGFPDSSSYYQQADAALGMTGRQFRRGGGNIDITWVCGDAPLGRCLVAESERGVCAVLPGEDDALLYAELASLFPNARLHPGDEIFRQRVAQVFSHLDDHRQPFSLPLDLRGTAFQLQVWQALRQIPAGETRSYRQVAQSIGRPRAVRAVASACAANKLALVIPCHRVVREDGALSGYRWGTARKALLLAREASSEEK